MTPAQTQKRLNQMERRLLKVELQLSVKEKKRSGESKMRMRKLILRKQA